MNRRVGFGKVQESNVLPSGAIGRAQSAHDPRAKCLDNRPQSFVSEKPHLHWNRIGLVFVGQVAGVGQAGENILSRQARVVYQELALGLAGREEFENELDGQTRPPDHWFAGQDLRMHDDALGKRHDHSLPC